MSRNVSDSRLRDGRKKEISQPNDERKRRKSHPEDDDGATPGANGAGPRAVSPSGGGSVLREQLKLGSQSSRGRAEQLEVSNSRSKLSQLRPKRKQTSARGTSKDISEDSNPSTARTTVSLAAASARVLVRERSMLHTGRFSYLF